MNVNEPLGEVELSVVAKVLKQNFGVWNEPVENRPYSVRFIGSPYNTFVPDCPSIQVMAHHRGESRGMVLSPHNIRAVLAKFDIEEADFLTALRSPDTQKPPTPQQQTSRRQSVN
jgi:hypothetical protein